MILQVDAVLGRKNFPFGFDEDGVWPIAVMLCVVHFNDVF